MFIFVMTMRSYPLLGMKVRARPHCLTYSLLETTRSSKVCVCMLVPRLPKLACNISEYISQKVNRRSLV